MTILQEVKTSKNLQVLMTELDSAILSITGSTSGDVASIVKKDAPKHGDTILRYLNIRNAFTKKEAAKVLEELARALEKVEELEISIAIDPSESFVSGILDWVHKNISTNVVVDMKKNPALVGGATITYKGKYSDYSLEKKLSEHFEQVKKEKAT